MKRFWILTVFLLACAPSLFVACRKTENFSPVPLISNIVLSGPYKDSIKFDYADDQKLSHFVFGLRYATGERSDFFVHYTNGRIASIAYTFNHIPYVTYTYAYDASGKVVQRTTTSPQVTDKIYRTYTYNALNWVIKVQDSSGYRMARDSLFVMNAQRLFYYYDFNGNLTQVLDTTLLPLPDQSPLDRTLKDSLVKYGKNGMVYQTNIFQQYDHMKSAFSGWDDNTKIIVLDILSTRYGQFNFLWASPNNKIFSGGVTYDPISSILQSGSVSWHPIYYNQEGLPSMSAPGDDVNGFTVQYNYRY